MRVRRRPVVDEYVEDGVAAILVDKQVVVVSTLATELLRRIPTAGVDLEMLADGLVETFGPPPGDEIGRAATLKLVKELADQGLVVLTDEGPD